MTNPSPRTHLALSLARLPHVGTRRLRHLLTDPASTAVDSPSLLTAFAVTAAHRLGFEAPTAQACGRAWDEGARLAERCGRLGWHVWVIGETPYPAALLRLSDPPAVLFVHGPAVLPPAPRLAIVGTRDPTPWGQQTADACARAAAAEGGIVVSGLAWGIDTAAHEGALAGAGATWAILPGALDVVFPPSNQELAERIAHGGGALVSEYVPGTRPHPTFFVERDRLQAALSDVVLVIETGRTGGTHHTIRAARGLGVPVWITLPPEVVAASGNAAVPPAQEGTRDMWKAGAPIVTPADVTRWAREGPRTAPRDAGDLAQRRLF
jgi:DNA processing protein